MALNHGDLFMFEAPKKHAGKSSVPGTTPAAPRFDLAQTSLRAGLEAKAMKAAAAGGRRTA